MASRQIGWSRAARAVLAAVIVWRVGLDGQTSAPRTVVVAELFTSEGCSSCPPADDVLSRLAREQPVPGVEIVALGEHVDYWDRLGWRDRFSSSAFSLRQSNYDESVFHGNGAYTPQLVVDGGFEHVGNDPPGVRKAIEQAARAPKATVAVTAARSDAGRNLQVGVHVQMPQALAAREPVDVLVAITENNLATVVRSGENGGHTLRHDAVVRYLTTAGTVTPHEGAFTLAASVRWEPEWKAADVRVVAFLQQRRSRHIVGAGSAGVDALSGNR